MHRLTSGRFTRGLGRGIAPLVKALGLPPVTTAQLEDFVALMRRLWHGETVVGHDGPAGTFPFVCLDPYFDEDIPLASPRSGRRRWRSADAPSTTSRCTRSSRTRRWCATCAL